MCDFFIRGTETIEASRRSTWSVSGQIDGWIKAAAERQTTKCKTANVFSVYYRYMYIHGEEGSVL